MIPLMSSSESENESENEQLSLPSTDEMEECSADLMRSDSALELRIHPKGEMLSEDENDSDDFYTMDIPDEECIIGICSRFKARRSFSKYF